MSEQTEGSIFQITERRAQSPVIVDSKNIFQELGYEELTDEESDPYQKSVVELFKSTVILKDNPNAFFGTGDPPLIDESRSQLPLPQVHVLRKDDKTYLSICFNTETQIITDSEPTISVMRNGKRIKGLNVRQIMYQGQHGRSIDLLSLSLGEPARNIFTFADFSPFFARERVYSSLENNIILPSYKSNNPDRFEKSISENGTHFGNEVLLSMPTTRDEDNITWSPEAFPFMVLHENAHNTDYQLVPDEKRAKWVTPERKANAIVLQMVRKLDLDYPEDRFFDPKSLRQDIRNQMIEGYGELK